VSSRDRDPIVTFTIKNTGTRSGAEVAEVYLALRDSSGEPPRRLVGWQNVMLQPTESRSVAVKIDPKMLAIFDTDQGVWKTLAGDYRLYVGSSSRQFLLHSQFSVREAGTVR